MLRRSFFILLGLGLTLGCSSTNKIQTKVPRDRVDAPENWTEPAIRRMTTNGENWNPRWVGGGKLMVLSANRLKHKHAQIYLIDLVSQREKRLVYQDGVIIDFDVTSILGASKKADSTSPTATIYFASTTDEAKEDPLRIFDDAASLTTLQPEPPNHHSMGFKTGTEIYSLNLSSDVLSRLTQSKGFDFEIATAPTGSLEKSHSDLFYSREKDGTFKIYKVPARGGSGSAITEGPHDRRAQLSTNGTGVYFVSTPGGDTANSNELWRMELRSKKKTQIASGLTHMSRVDVRPSDPLVIPKLNQGKAILEDLVFSARIPGADQSELYFAKSDGSCLTRLTYSEADDRDPLFSYEGNRLVFVSDRHGTFQIYEQDFTTPTCPVKADTSTPAPEVKP